MNRDASSPAVADESLGFLRHLVAAGLRSLAA